ncbi:MAG TPA: ABC transporter permease [Gammaproteobacteria bacterium]|nr:ABC transporter permease [Gammaproteobacteria bacterium]
MIVEDVLRYSFNALVGYRRRTYLMLLAMAIGVAAVVMLTSLGEGARLYVTNQFSSLGTHLLIVLPGRNETSGGAPPGLGETPRDLTLQDALSLTRSTAVRRIAPIAVGAAPVSWQHREREVSILGSTPELYPIRHLEMAQGQFLPPGDPERGAPYAVLGAKLRHELFGSHQALGEWIRIGDSRFRVVGILAEQGQSLGVDMGDVAIIPVASAQSLFNTNSLFRILIQAKSREDISRAKHAVESILQERHEGERDVTVITQDAVLATFDRILRALTMTVGGIAAISLAVAGILIMNVMLVAVSQRTAEIGLLKALGAPQRQVATLFLTEAAALSLLGALVGLLFGLAGNAVIGHLFPSFPIEAPLWSVAAALGVALLTGLVFGVLPARRAARLDPVQALSRR